VRFTVIGGPGGPVIVIWHDCDGRPPDLSRLGNRTPLWAVFDFSTALSGFGTGKKYTYFLSPDAINSFAKPVPAGGVDEYCACREI